MGPVQQFATAWADSGSDKNYDAEVWIELLRWIWYPDQHFNNSKVEMLGKHLLSHGNQLPGVKFCHHLLQHFICDGGKHLNRKSWNMQSKNKCNRQKCFTLNLPDRRNLDQGWCKSQEGHQALAWGVIYHHHLQSLPSKHVLLILSPNLYYKLTHLKRILRVMLTFWRSLDPVMAGTFFGL